MMRQTQKPSARFLGLLRGQAVIRGDTRALAIVGQRMNDWDMAEAVCRHSADYVVRRLSQEWMTERDEPETVHRPRARAAESTRFVMRRAHEPSHVRLSA